MKPVLAAEALAVSWQPNKWVFQDVDLTLLPGEFLGVVGPSGCGKSTLCLALAGIIPRQLQAQVTGSIRLAGQDLAQLSLPQIAGSLGIVFQDPQSQLFLPQVRRELAFGPENLCVEPKKIAARIEEIAEQVGCHSLLSANPNELSGGEQQLIALASVLAMAPAVLILDEVTAQLDTATARRLAGVIGGLRKQGVAVLMIEHNLEQLAAADKILALNNGRLQEVADVSSEEALAQAYGGDEVGGFN